MRPFREGPQGAAEEQFFRHRGRGRGEQHEGRRAVLRVPQDAGDGPVEHGDRPDQPGGAVEQPEGAHASQHGQHRTVIRAAAPAWRTVPGQGSGGQSAAAPGGGQARGQQIELAGAGSGGQGGCQQSRAADAGGTDHPAPVKPGGHWLARSASRRSRSASRTASSYGMGSKGMRSRMDGSRTMTSLVIESMSVRPVEVSTSVTSASHRDDSQGVSSGTGRITMGRPSMAATRLSMVEYRNTSGPPASKTRPAASGSSSTPRR